jgi:hypothetical protein
MSKEKSLTAAHPIAVSAVAVSVGSIDAVSVPCRAATTASVAVTVVVIVKGKESVLQCVIQIEKLECAVIIAVTAAAATTVVTRRK